MVKPYIDYYDNGSIIRTFDSKSDDEELVWHRDKKNREVTVLDGVGWKIQFENKLPINLEKGKLYHIKAMEYHRLLKGVEGLTLRIWEK